MPLFVDASGEGIYVAPKPFRSSVVALARAEKLKRLARCLLWFRLHKEGMTFENIAELVERPTSTIKDGVRHAEKYIARRQERETREVVELSPLFGVLPLTPARQDSFQRTGRCKICGANKRGANKVPRSTIDPETGRCVAGVGNDGLVCGGCGCVTPTLQDRFDREIDQDRTNAAKVERNRQEIPAVPESHYESIQARLDLEQDLRREASSETSPTYKSVLVDHLTASPVS